MKITANGTGIVILSVAKDLLFLFAVFFLLVTSASAQIQTQTTGTPKFGSFSGGPDVIDNANLNVQITIPVFHRAGRSLNFDFNLVYQSSIWGPLTATGAHAWTPSSNWGWGTGGTEIGHITFTRTDSTTTCIIAGHNFSAPKTVWTNFVYYDGSGTAHAFDGSAVGIGAQCSGSGTNQTTGFSGNALDGSGFNLNVAGDCCAIRLDATTVTSPSGNQIIPLGGVKLGQTPGSIQDPNGNFITADTSGHLTDTLGTVAITTAGAAPNPVTYTYTAPSAASAAYTVNYTTYSIQTNFGCSGVGDYGINGTTTASLVSEIDLPDIATNSSDKYTFTYEPTPGHSGFVTGRLASVTLPTGGTISYSYTGSNNGIECGDGTTAGFTRTTPDGAWSYTRTLGTVPTSSTTITDPQGNQTFMQFVGTYPTVEQVYQGPIAPANLLRSTTTCYDGLTSNCATTIFGTPISQRAVTIQLGTNGPQCKHVYLYDGGAGTLNTGVLNEQDDYDYGPSAPGALLRKTLYTYKVGIPTELTNVKLQNASGTILSQTTYTYDETAVTAPPNQPTPQHNSVGSQPRRNLTTLNNGLTQHWTYYDTGAVATHTDVNGAVTTNNYGSLAATCGNSYPTSISEPLSMSQFKTWNCTGGVGVSLTDENSQQSTITYNDPSFWRPAQQNSPDGGQTSWTYNSSTSITTSVKITSSQNITTTTLLDSLGRVSQTQLVSDPVGATYVDTTYDSLGRTKTVSNPHRATAGPTDGTTTTFYDALDRVCLVVPPDGTLPSGNGCPAAQPTNTVFGTYSGNTATVMDQTGKSRKSVADGLGRLIQVFEDPAGLNFETDYAYDALGNLLCVAQKGTNTGTFSNCASTPASWRPRTFTYDSLSRLLTVNNPESGSVTYTYDTSGNLATKTSPKPNQTGTTTVVATYSYDTLHRLTQKSFNDGSTPTVKYVYDAAAAPSGCTLPTLTISNGIGRRTGMCDGAGSEAWAYDSMGRSLFDKRTTNNLTKQFGYTYNLDGSLATITTPAGEVETYTQGAAGRSIGFTSSFGGNFAYNVHYTPGGAVCFMNFGWGNTYTHRYTFNNRLQPVAMQEYGDVTHGATPAYPPCAASNDTTGTRLDLTYNFVDTGGHNNGDVVSITNNYYTPISQSFTYDSLNRLTTAQTTATHATDAANCWAETYNYDAWGNLLKLGLDTTNQSAYVGCTQESGFDFTNFISTNNRITASGYGYDSAGNLTTNPGVGSQTFDAENNLISTGGVTYTYDGDGKRVMKSSGTIYWYGGVGSPLQESDLTGANTYTHYYFNGRRIGRREPTNGVDHYSLDQLGNARWVVSNNGGWDVSDFYPFGGERVLQSASNNHYKFTSQERDSESGLDHFSARFNSSTLGRFISPDPENAGADLSVPQSWNAYSYVLNNPINAIDPDGLDCVYLDNNGGTNPTGPNGFSVDHNSDPQKCSETQGTWLEGNIAESSVSADTYINWISGTDQAGKTQSGCNGSSDQCSDESFSAFFGNTQRVFVNGNDPPDVPLTQAQIEILGGVYRRDYLLYRVSTCAAGVVRPLLPAPNPDDIAGMIVEDSKSGAEIASEGSEATADAIKQARRLGPSRLKRIAKLTNRAEKLGKVAKCLEGVGYVLSIPEIYENYQQDCKGN